jgi:type IV secretion system protein VirD4
MKKRQSIYFWGICSVLAFYLLNRASVLYQSVDGDLLQRTNSVFDGILLSIEKRPMLIGLDKGSLFTGICGLTLIWLIYLYNNFGTKKYMPGKEHGSAEFGTSEDIEPFIDPNPDKNIILTETESLSMDGRMKDKECNRNNSQEQ